MVLTTDSSLLHFVSSITNVGRTFGGFSFTDIHIFEPSILAPSCPTVQGIGSSPISTSSPYIQWNYVPDAVTYRISFDTIIPPRLYALMVAYVNAFRWTDTTSRNITLGPLQPSTQYFIQIASVGYTGATLLDCPIVNFTTAASAAISAYPYFENFEQGPGGWQPTIGSTWDFGIANTEDRKTLTTVWMGGCRYGKVCS